MRDRSVIYFDHAATTPIRPEVLDRMLPYLCTHYGNPSGGHSLSRRARETVEGARRAVADCLNAPRDSRLIFTSGGTEADNLAVFGLARAHGKPGDHILTTRIEHKAVLRACAALEQEGYRVTYLPVDCQGRVDPAEAEAAVEPRTVLASIMLVNNEVGTIQPVQEIARRLRQRGVLVHTDAVQAAGPLDLNVQQLGVHALSLSGHKLYGPKGVGALWVEGGLQLTPLLRGGGQEGNYRSGTENVAALVGLAQALALCRDDRGDTNRRVGSLSRRLTEQVTHRVPGCRLTGHPTHRHPGIVSLVLDGLNGAELIDELDRRGIAASGASACSANEASHVLQAMGPGLVTGASLRLSLGRNTTTGEVDTLVHTLEGAVARLRSKRRFAMGNCA